MLLRSYTLQGQIRAGTWCYEVVGSCEVQFSASSQPDKNLYVCVRLHSRSCEVKFVQERGIARLWEVARFDFLLPSN